MRLLRRGFHILLRNASFPAPIDMGYHNPSLEGSMSSLAHRFSFDIICEISYRWERGTKSERSYLEYETLESGSFIVLFNWL